MGERKKRVWRNEAETEALRLRGIALLKQGTSHGTIATELDVAKRTVRKWSTLYRQGGAEGLRVRGIFHKHPYLDEAQKARLVTNLLAGPRAAGFDTDLWTCPRIQTLIEREFGVRYHVDALPRFLHALGFSPQRPEKVARERDQRAITTWVHKTWPDIKKSSGTGSQDYLS